MHLNDIIFNFPQKNGHFVAWMPMGFFSNRIEQIRTSQFVRGLAVLVSGTLAGQAILFLTTPIITRLYAPGDFGVLGYYSALVMLFSVPACLRFDFSAAIAEDEFDGINLLVLAIASATCFVLIGSLVVLAASNTAFLIRAIRPLGGHSFWFVVVGVWLAALYSAAQFWSIRKQRFAVVALGQVTRAAVASGSQISIGLLAPTGLGLVIGQMIYGGIGTAQLAGLLIKYDRNTIRGVSFSSLLTVGRRWIYRNTYSFFDSILDTFSSYFPMLAVSFLTSPHEAGQFFLAQRLLGVPISLIGSNLSRAFIGEASGRRAIGSLGTFTRTIVRNLTVLSFVPFLGLFILAPIVIPFVLGPAWAQAGETIQWLAPSLFVQFIVSPVSSLPSILGAQRFAFSIQLIHASVVIAVIVAAALTRTIQFVEIYAIANLAFYLFYLGSVLVKSRIADDI